MAHDFYCDEVLQGKVQIDKVWETDNVLAFHHTRPSYPVHIMIIPKMHVDSLLSLCDDSIILELMDVIKKVVDQVTKEHGGCRLTTNFGTCQTTKHLHWHVYVDEKMML